VRGPLNLGQVNAILHHLVERRKLAQMLDNINHFRGHVVHFGLRVKAAQSESYGTVGHIVSETQSVAEVQAEPLETAMSLMPISSDSPST